MSTTTISAPSITEAVQQARKQQEAWVRKPVYERLRPVHTMRRLLVEECDNICAAVGRDIGKPADEALAGDVLPFADACRFLERRAEKLLRPRHVPLSDRPLWLWGQRDTVYRRPRGLIGIIGTWNYPIYLNGVQLVQALTAGNAVIWKPSEVSPASAEVLFSLVRKAGYPEGLVQLLEPTRQAGQDLLEAEIDHVVFTGSAATGRRIAETLGRRLISSTLELSGCDAMFVLHDADVKLAARAAWFGATINRGQTCIAVRRALVHRSVYPAFTEALQALATNPPVMELALGSQAQQAERLVNDAVEHGARLIVGGTTNGKGTGEQCTPAVLVDVRPEMAICREASFAPLLTVMPFDTEADALRSDAQCSYGLGASIFTSNRAKANELASQLRTGMVTINDVIVPTAHPALPFGGRAESGWGVTQGEEGLLEMTVPQTVGIRKGSFRPHLDLAPGAPAGSQAELTRGLLQSSHAGSFGQRLRGFVRMIRALRSAK